MRGEEGGRHARLHDFCLTIPFGGVTLLAGAVSLIFGSGEVGGLITLSGAALCACALLSLKAWKAGLSSAQYTAASTGVTTGLCALLWRDFQQRGRAVAPALLLALGVAMLVFYIYNICSGGNPPKRKAE
ncbi:unnamed protein product [Ostreobium quekettii]|uniref:Uncharacterized protein n=1 Tax=Ostreobium quekettii TaxID=121088 RepID=A0A8S1IYR8_9CHLO|nr:unnamed protein product [Ostreobium quekettii]|eukprot:evm.model.scf_535.4 EVM.evm.TU.scf_535.4   scf_535:36416-38881(+)